MVKSNLFSVWKNREVELRRNITYKEVAAGTGISTATLQRWMTGAIKRFDAHSIDKLCQFFGCEIADLIVRDSTVEGQATVT